MKIKIRNEFKGNNIFEHFAVIEFWLFVCWNKSVIRGRIILWKFLLSWKQPWQIISWFFCQRYDKLLESMENLARNHKITFNKFYFQNKKHHYFVIKNAFVLELKLSIPNWLTQLIKIELIWWYFYDELIIKMHNLTTASKRRQLDFIRHVAWDSGVIVFLSKLIDWFLHCVPVF